MADHRIVCTNQEPVGVGHDMAHIVEGGHNGIGSRVVIESVSVIRQKIDLGHTYHTVSPSTGRRATVHKFECACGYRTIRSGPDAVKDNNLDNLDRCTIG